MTESMLTTRLSSVITGCGGNDTTCSRRSISGRSRSMNGTTSARPGVERAVVAAEPLDDARRAPAGRSGPCARAPRARRSRRSATTMRGDHRSSFTRRRAPWRPRSSRPRPACPARAPGRACTRAPTTPRRRCCTRPPCSSTRCSTTACAPSSAAVPVRIAARHVQVRARDRAQDAERGERTRRRRRGAAARAAAPSERGDRGRHGGERDRAEEEEARREDLAHGRAATLRSPRRAKRPRSESRPTPEAERREERRGRRCAARSSGARPCAVDEDRAHPDRERALDVVLDRVADHRRIGRLDLEQVEHRAEDRRVRLRLPVVERADARVDLERVVAGELADVARGVRDEADLQARARAARRAPGIASS